MQASPTKKFLPSRPMINFCTAVVVEVLGSVTTVDSDAVKRILPFVVSGLQPGTKGGPDHKVSYKTIVTEILINRLILCLAWYFMKVYSHMEVITGDGKAKYLIFMECAPHSWYMHVFKLYILF